MNKAVKKILIFSFILALLILSSCGPVDTGDIRIHICVEQYNTTIDLSEAHSPQEIEQRCRYSDFDMEVLEERDEMLFLVYERGESVGIVIVDENPLVLRNLEAGDYKFGAEIGVIDQGKMLPYTLLGGANLPSNRSLWEDCPRLPLVFPGFGEIEFNICNAFMVADVSLVTSYLTGGLIELKTPYVLLDKEIIKNQVVDLGFVWRGSFDTASYFADFEIGEEDNPYIDSYFGNNKAGLEFVKSQGRITGKTISLSIPDSYALVEGPLDFPILSSVYENQTLEDNCQQFDSFCYLCGSFQTCRYSFLDTELPSDTYTVLVNSTSFYHSDVDENKENNVVENLFHNCIEDPANNLILENNTHILSVEEHADEKLVVWSIRDESDVLFYNVSNIRFDCPSDWNCEALLDSFSIGPGESKFIMQQISFEEQCPVDGKEYNIRLRLDLDEKGDLGCEKSFLKEFDVVITTNVSNKCLCEDLLPGIQGECDQLGEKGCWAYGHCCGDQEDETWAFQIVNNVDDVLVNSTCFKGEWYYITSEKITYYDIKSAKTILED